MMFRYSIAVIFFILLSQAASAQQKSSVAVLLKSKADGTWIRWAPADPVTWQLGNKYGYTIERFSLRPDGEMETNSPTLLTATPVKPLTEAQFDKAGETSDEVAALQELIYSKDFKPVTSSSDLASVLAKNNELENRFGMALLMCDLSIEAATAGALFFKDISAQKGKRYIYRIQVASSATTLVPGVGMITVSNPKPLSTITDLKATFGNKKTTLRWGTLLHKGIYSAYHIERSTDGKNFKRLTEIPYVHMSEKLESENAFFIDSVDVNQKTFYYRIQGISPFSEIGSYSNVVSGEGKDDLTGVIIIREGIVLEQRNIKIAWEFPVTLEKQITGFYVSSAASHDGPYTDLNKKALAKYIREFTQPTAFNNTYYAVRAVDKNGIEVARSFPYLVQIADVTPPNVPSGLMGSISKDGITSLNWTVNTDKDLLGYRVFRTNSLGEEFVEVTKDILLKPTFTDSVNIHVLNKKIFYSIVAVDKNFNPSNYSIPVQLQRPDIIAPAAPVITRTEALKDTIALAWLNSVSDDIAKYELTKIEKDERLSRVLITWYSSSPISVYKDQSLTPGKTYQYKITAYDSSGNKGETTSREVYYEPGYRDAVKEIKSTADREGKKISLEWKNGTPSTRCIIYRKINDGPLKIFVTIEGNIESYVDTKISPNNIYTYKVQPIFTKGIRALISEEIKVVY